MTLALKPFLPLRQRPPVFESHDVDEVRGYLGEAHDGFDVKKSRSERFFLAIHARRLENITTCYIRSAAPVHVSSQASRRDYSLLLPLRWHVEAMVGREQVDCGARYGVIGSPSLPETIVTRGSSDRGWVSIDQARLTRLAAALTGEAVDTPIVFAPTVDLESDLGRRLLRIMAFAVSELARDESAFHHPLLEAQFEQLLLTALLLSQPSNYTPRLTASDHPIAPRDVNRVLEYIRANLDQPIALEDLVAVSGVPGRTLQQHFRSFKGLSPMAYLRKARLEHAHKTLLTADDDIRIVDVALQSGFSHLGRFAVEYRKRFGESPSETLARRARRRG